MFSTVTFSSQSDIHTKKILNIVAKVYKITGGSLTADEAAYFTVHETFSCKNAKIKAPEIYFSCPPEYVDFGNCVVEGNLHFNYIPVTDEL
jgi:alanine-alpha-ketoisovalerate/valine-pyruvate aminotransferase